MDCSIINISKHPNNDSTQRHTSENDESSEFLDEVNTDEVVVKISNNTEVEAKVRDSLGEKYFMVHVYKNYKFRFNKVLLPLRIAQFLWFIGRSSGVFIGGLLLNAFGPRVMYQITAALNLATAVFYAAFLYTRWNSTSKSRTTSEDL